MGSDLNFPELDVARSQEGGVELVALAGELDLSTVDGLDGPLAGAGVGREGARVCLDLSALNFIDSAGIASVLKAQKATVRAGGQLVVVGAPGPVWRTFEMTGLVELIQLASSRDAALARFGSAD